MKTRVKLLKSLAKSLASFLPTVFVLAILAGGWLAIHKLNSHHPAHDEEATTVDEGVAQDVLKLPEGKLKSAELESFPAVPQQVEHLHTIPGRIRYDETKHVDVKAPMDGMLKEVLVTPGQTVAQGHVMAILLSPEIGQARAAVLKCMKDRELAQQVFERDRVVAENLAAMLQQLDQGSSIQAIESSTSNQTLGSYRQDILSSFAKVQLANELLAKVESLSTSGAIPGRTIRERETERQVAETAYRTARDQALFAANQAKLNSEAKLTEADRQLNLAWQAVEALLGYKENRSRVDLSSEEAMSRLEIRAPFTGSVESRGFANNERVMRGDSLIVLANTDSLYVSASIRENDWPAIGIQPESIIQVQVPALENRVFEALVRYIGREVQSETNSMPLVATIDNSQGLLRPGMFVRVTIPMNQTEQQLSVRPESVVQHENQSFVFVDLGDGRFRKVDVATGRSSEDWIEIKSGISAGDLVVTKGAFLLKSELLLQGAGE
jgi:cobalt-zinc-cadmium efflux system membrane fusion protein